MHGDPEEPVIVTDAGAKYAPETVPEADPLGALDRAPAWDRAASA